MQREEVVSGPAPSQPVTGPAPSRKVWGPKVVVSAREKFNTEFQGKFSERLDEMKHRSFVVEYKESLRKKCENVQNVLLLDRLVLRLDAYTFRTHNGENMIELLEQVRKEYKMSSSSVREIMHVLDTDFLLLLKFLVYPDGETMHARMTRFHCELVDAIRTAYSQEKLEKLFLDGDCRGSSCQSLFGLPTGRSVFAPTDTGADYTNVCPAVSVASGKRQPQSLAQISEDLEQGTVSHRTPLLGTSCQAPDVQQASLPFGSVFQIPQLCESLDLLTMPHTNKHKHDPVFDGIAASLQLESKSFCFTGVSDKMQKVLRVGGPKWTRRFRWSHHLEPWMMMASFLWARDSGSRPQTVKCARAGLCRFNLTLAS